MVCTCETSELYGAETSELGSRIGAAVTACGVSVKFATVSCGDTDGSFTIENIGSDHVLDNVGATYGRGYDPNSIAVPGVVTSSNEWCVLPFGIAKTTP